MRRDAWRLVTGNGEVQTRSQATVFFFVTVMLLEDALAVLSLGTLCEDHG